MFPVSPAHIATGQQLQHQHGFNDLKPILSLGPEQTGATEKMNQMCSCFHIHSNISELSTHASRAEVPIGYMGFWNRPVQNVEDNLPGLCSCVGGIKPSDSPH